MKKVFLLISLFILSLVVLGDYVNILDVKMDDFGEKYKIVSYDELLKNNGQNGNDSWIAVNGIIYDVTYSKAWKDGMHKNGIVAGKDLTYEITKISPHGVGKLNNLDKIGILGFTLNDLKKSDGKNGNKAYVAVNGIVYDMSHSKAWKDGMHKNGIVAGKDLTYEITKLSPHGLKKLENVYPIGILILTPSDLKMFDGKGNNKAYVAVNGVVYDMSYSKAWKNGMHKNGIVAGKELTYEIIELSPHGLKKLDNVFKIGYFVFSEKELSMYNGKNGNKAYVAVNGIVYDMSYSKAWKNGEHKNGIVAGKDLTYEITELSPHGLGKLNNVYKIGFLLK
jgi:predicted heme/steroid binding protein